jgi:SEC-C motif
MAVGRNHPCPCGSGRKFKRCCITVGNSQPKLLETEAEPHGRVERDPIARTAHAPAAMIAGEGNATLDKPAQDFLAEYPECLLLFLDGFMESGNEAAGEEHEELADAYYYLLGIELTLLRVSLEHRYEWAQQLRDDYERRIIDAIRGGEASVEQIVALTNAMIRERVKPGAELMAVCADAFGREAAGRIDNLDPAVLCAEMVAQCNDDPFAIRDALYSSAHFADDAFSVVSIRALLAAPQAAMKEGAALGVLDSDPAVRSAAAAALVEAAGSISPPTLRRLIGVRRWLAEPERPPIDRAVRAARLTGVECAQWAPSVKVVEIRASAPDGTGAQMAMIVSRANGGHQLSGLLFNRNSGIADVWTSDSQSMGEIKEMLDEQSSGVRLLRVSRAYLDAMVGYYLRGNLMHGTPPPARLLALAEFLEAPQWQPAEFGWREKLAGLIAEVRSELLAPASVHAIIATSAKWAMRRQWAASWAEEGQEVEDLLDRLDGRSMKTVRDKIIDQILEKRRDIWAERFTLTALWMKEAPRRVGLPWEHFAIVAQKMIDEVPLRELPLMQRIAEVTAYM